MYIYIYILIYTVIYIKRILLTLCYRNNNIYILRHTVLQRHDLAQLYSHITLHVCNIGILYTTHSHTQTHTFIYKQNL